MVGRKYRTKRLQSESVERSAKDTWVHYMDWVSAFCGAQIFCTATQEARCDRMYSIMLLHPLLSDDCLKQSSLIEDEPVVLWQIELVLVYRTQAVTVHTSLACRRQ
jgi:hypothetical protein